jgi:hypothetical protein
VREARRPGPDREDLCKCDEIREFLQGELDPRDPYDSARDLLNPKTGYAWLSRAVTVQPDLRFSARVDTTTEHDAEAVERRKKHGGRGGMVSYRTMARYETLGKMPDGQGFFSDYRTIEEFEAETNRDHRTALYREDFCGLDNPEADFIQHAAEDIPYLLAVIDNLREQNEQLARGDVGDDPDAKRDLDR